MKLRDIFIEILKERGISKIGTSISKIIRSADPIQKMAVYLACKKVNVCYAKKKLKYSFNLEGKLVNEPPEAYLGRCNDVLLTPNEFLERVKEYKFPYIAVDCSFYNQHSKREKRSLFVQIRETLNVVRNYMWDDRLILTLNCGIGKYYSTLAEFIKKEDINKVILLDPNASSVFHGEMADCYIIGGIVDKSGEKKGLTTKIGEILSENNIKFESKKIVLRGDTTGVPDRINAIAEIILRVVLDKEDINDAIKKVQSPIFARKRLAKELPKFAIRAGTKEKTFRLVSKSIFNEFNWLNLRKEDFYKVCSQTGHIVVSEHVFESIKNYDWDVKSRKYLLQSNQN